MNVDDPPLHDHEARALWHLELGYADFEPLGQDATDGWIDDDDDAYLAECLRCGGEGIILFCCDDICHGLGYCMHGDGQAVCRACHGEGFTTR